MKRDTRSLATTYWGRLAAACGLFAVPLCAASSRDCAPCHPQIYISYRETPMALSSGAVKAGSGLERFDQAAFDHSPSGFRYRVSQNGGGIAFDFSKPGGVLAGSKQLVYFVGSGATARSYLLQDDGYLYEAPVAYYSASHKWGLAPGYDSYSYPYLTRPVMPGCLACHATALKVVAGTQNRYADPPFAEDGIGCERCHGPGDAHIRKMQAGNVEGGSDIVNPARLAPGRRDDVCGQCHLTGEVRVMKPGEDWRSYNPGDRLADSMTVFVRAAASPGVKVTSHMEKLAQSGCKRSSGDRLWCGSCHDPHAVPSSADRVAWFRKKCLACHDSAACKEKLSTRQARGDDCTFCHMPKSTATDAQHVVYTDHSIPRRPRTDAARTSTTGLEVLGGEPAQPRDLALAYAIVASRTHAAADQQRALGMLQAVERQRPDDVDVLLYLGELYRLLERGNDAIPLYRRAIRLDPAQVTASVGLGGVLMERGNYAEAVALWQDALSKNGGLELVRMNMAMAQLRLGDPKAAEATLVKAVELNPGFAAAIDLLAKVRKAQVH